jgi:Na+-transporting methylmalonyl-CoA/oxaloacetate decarboxylase gamma subunit
VFEAIGIFVAGISGVFLGMGLLYLSIKIVSAVTSRFSSDEGEK